MVMSAGLLAEQNTEILYNAALNLCSCLRMTEKQINKDLLVDASDISIEIMSGTNSFCAAQRHNYLLQL